jgi:eukaryotic-like serine/threonine-protein kinase
VAELPTIEGFRLIEELGSGSLSSVYKAVDELLGRVVALKVLKNTIAPDSPFAAQLEREAQVLGTLCHPNVGLLYSFAKGEARMHLVLEYVDGLSLASLTKKRPTLPPEVVAAIGGAVARGLGHAHERGVVHRDVKPANVMVSRRGEVKIFDFGIAQGARVETEPVALAPLRVEDVTAFGTPAYMAPEQILGENVDARSDIFSLGVVLYQLLCGARPFERGDETDQRPAAHRIRRDPPIPLHRRAPDVPHALERIVMRAIQKLPADRFQTAEAMADELEELAAARSGLRGDALIVQALEHAGLVDPSGGRGAVASTRRKRGSVRRAIAGLATLGGIAVGAAVVIQAASRREGESAGTRPLDLVPPSPGYLRVLATPWAEVWIDGQRAEVTPFARAIPLPQGTHYVTLVHPRATAEKRTITIAPGETRTIDVVMAISQPPREDSGADPAQEKEKRP